MGKARWVIWSAFFALLANVASGFGLASASPAVDDVASPRTICQTQASIATLVESTFASGASALCSLHDVLDGATDVPEQQSLDVLQLVVLLTDRPASVPQEQHACALIAAFDAEPQSGESDRRESVFSDCGSGPPENRYRFLLTPHAPPVCV